MQRCGTPEIFNTDQGAQFTSETFTGMLRQAGVVISMDGKGRWINNVFVEQLWRKVKYEDVYLKAYESLPQLGVELGEYFHFFNRERRHQSLNRHTPNQVYRGKGGMGRGEIVDPAASEKSGFWSLAKMMARGAIAERSARQRLDRQDSLRAKQNTLKARSENLSVTHNLSAGHRGVHENE